MQIGGALMLDKILKWLLTIVGLILGYFVTDVILKIDYVKELLNLNAHSITAIILYICGIIILGLIFYLLSPFIIKLLWKITSLLENGLQKIPTNEIIIGIMGLIIGLLISYLLVGSVFRFFSSNSILSVIGSTISIISNVIFGTLGINVALKKKMIYQIYLHF